MSKTADKELVLNKETGEVDEIKASERTTPPEESFQVDDEEGYHFTVTIRSKKVYCRELTKAQFDAYQKEAKSISADMLAIQADAMKADADQDSISDRSVANSGRQAKQYAGLVEKCVAAWEFPKSGGGKLPCTAQTKAKLPLPVQCEMAMKIIQKSRMGQDESGF